MTNVINCGLLKKLEKQPAGRDPDANIGTSQQKKVLQHLHDMSDYQVRWIAHMATIYQQNARTARLLRLRIIRAHAELFKLWYKYRGQNVSPTILRKFTNAAHSLYDLLPLRN